MFVLLLRGRVFYVRIVEGTEPWILILTLFIHSEFGVVSVISGKLAWLLLLVSLIPCNVPHDLLTHFIRVVTGDIPTCSHISFEW